MAGGLPVDVPGHVADAPLRRIHAVVHEYAPPPRKFCSRLGLCLASVAAAVLLIDYFIQVTVMQPSLEKGQLDGWTMCTRTVSSSLSRSSGTC